MERDPDPVAGLRSQYRRPGAVCSVPGPADVGERDDEPFLRDASSQAGSTSLDSGKFIGAYVGSVIWLWQWGEYRVSVLAENGKLPHRMAVGADESPQPGPYAVSAAEVVQVVARGIGLCDMNSCIGAVSVDRHAGEMKGMFFISFVIQQADYEFLTRIGFKSGGIGITVKDRTEAIGGVFVFIQPFCHWFRAAVHTGILHK